MRDERSAALIVSLTQRALVAPDVPTAVTPMLGCLVERTAAAGSAYFQVKGEFFFARASAGVMPSGPVMEAIAAHGLPAGSPLMTELSVSSGPLFVDDTSSAPAAAGFPDLGVASLTAASVLHPSGALLGAFLMHAFAEHPWSHREADLFAAMSGTLAGVAARLVAEEQAVAAREGALRALGLALEYRDGETNGHTDRVTTLALRISGALGLDDEGLTVLRWGAYLHDVGKIAIPDAILLKLGRLDAGEWERMQGHAAMGHDFATQLAFLPAGALDVVLHHHERWDGTGYPGRCRGEAIPLPARIFSVCDVYDALTSVRPNKSAWTHAEDIAEIEAQSGRQFDPAVVAAFLQIATSATDVTDTDRVSAGAVEVRAA